MSIFDPAIDHLQKLIYASGLETDARKAAAQAIIVALVLGAALAFLLRGSYPDETAVAGGAGLFAAACFMSYLVVFNNAQRRVAMLEDALPEFLSVMASHIRSGQTYDRALLLSARKEFGPLSKEIEKVGKETLTGKPLADALDDLGRRVPSQSFSKSIQLVVKGIRSGGKLADLLEHTASDVRKFSAMKQEVAATVLVYQLFSFAAVCIGAPLLYAITTFLVGIFAAARSRIAFGQFSEPPSYLPFFQGAAISPELTFWFSIAALFITTLFGAFAAGVIAKGKETEGAPFLPILMVISFSVFFLVGFLLKTLLGGFFTTWGSS